LKEQERWATTRGMGFSRLQPVRHNTHQKLTTFPREENRTAKSLIIHRGFQVPVEVCCKSAIVSAERDGDLGLRQSLAGVCDNAVP